MPGLGFPFEQAERVVDGVDEWPVEVEQFFASAAREDDPGHASAGGAAFDEFGAQSRERHGFVSRELGQAGFDRG